MTQKTIVLISLLAMMRVISSSKVRDVLVNGTCLSDQFRCPNDVCIRRDQYCDGVKDCSDNSDEHFCSRGCNYNDKVYFSCNSEYRCIPRIWKCDGVRDCPQYGYDEGDCGIQTEDINRLRVGQSRARAQKWLLAQRQNESSTRKWGTEVARITIALYLSRSPNFFTNITLRSELAYELTLRLLEKIALNSLKNVSTVDLASYTNAMLATCVNPREFNTVNLVQELRDRVDSQNYTNPYALLALCNAGDDITRKDVAKLISAIRYPKKEFWTDTQALAILALSCASRQMHADFNSSDLYEFTLEVKKRQSRNGTIENLQTTALVMQALFAADIQSDDDNFEEDRAFLQILRAQEADGSFAHSLMDTYYSLPLLAYGNLASISDNHCRYPPSTEDDVLDSLINQPGAKEEVQYSTWIGSNKNMKRTISIKVSLNTTLYGVMQKVAGVDTTFKSYYSVRDGKPYVYRIARIQDDPEKGMFWFLYDASETPGNPRLIKKSPAEIRPTDKQHYAYWYRSGPWHD